MNRQHLKNLFDSFETSQNERDRTFFAYFRNITTISVGLIGLLIGLKPAQLPNLCSKYLFLTTIILIGLCILFSLVVQFYEVEFHKKQVSVRKEHISKYIADPENENLQIDSIKKRLIYKISEKMVFLCLLLSVTSLIFYVYFSEF